MNRRLLMVEVRTLAGYPQNSQANPTPGEFGRRTQHVRRRGRQVEGSGQERAGCKHHSHTRHFRRQTLRLRAAGICACLGSVSGGRRFDLFSETPEVIQLREARHGTMAKAKRMRTTWPFKSSLWAAPNLILHNS